MPLSHLSRRAALGLLAATVAMPATAQDRPVVATASYPLAYFAERLSGGAADVLFAVPANVDPSFWRPGIADITALQGAEVIALNGAGFATWPTKASLPRSRTIDTTAGLADRFIRTDTVTHSHGDAGEHSHTNTANYTWLDFTLASAQAEALATAMTRQMPTLADDIATHQNALLADLAALDAFAQQVGTAAGGTRIITSHPRYQYLGAAYGLDITAVDWDANADPTADQWAALEDMIDPSIPTIFIWEAEPTAASRDQMTSIGLTDVVFPPLANRPAEGDFLTQMQASLANLEATLNGI